jgi:hypothetical protein
MSIRDRALILGGGGLDGAKWWKVTNFHAREKGGSCKFMQEKKAIFLIFKLTGP